MQNVKKLLIVVLAFCIISCGGSGGGSTSSQPTSPPASPPSNPPVEPPPANDSAFSKYQGVSNRAIISNTNAHDIANQVTVSSDLAHLLSFTNDLRYARFDTLIFDYVRNVNDNCESGEVILGELVDDKIEIEYVQCVTGPYTLAGKGEFSDILVNGSGELNAATLTLENLQIQNAENIYQLEGEIYAVFGSVVTRSAVNDTLITNISTNQQVYLDNFQIGFDVLSAQEGYGIEGRIYLSEHGYVDISTLKKATNAPGLESDLTIVVETNDVLVLEHRDNGVLGVGLFANRSSLSSELVEIPYNFILSKIYENQSNVAPTAIASVFTPQIDKRTEFLFDASQSEDNNFDILNYQWEVVGKPEGASVNITNNGFVNAFSQFTIAGDYQFSLTVDDGELSSAPIFIDLYVRQDPPVISLLDSPNVLAFGEAYQNSVVTNNLSDDGPFEYSLHYAPSSMEVDVNGKLNWDGKIPRLGQNIEVNYAVKVANRDHYTIAKESVMLNDSLTSFAFQIDEYPRKVLGQFDFNNDGEPELLIGRGEALEIIDVANDLTAPLWAGSVPTKDVINVSYYAPSKSIYILQDTGKIYQIDTQTNVTSEVATVETSDFAFRGLFKVVADETSDNLKILGGRRILNLSDGSSTSTGILTFSIGDINGDGTLDYIDSSGAYSSDDLGQIVDNEFLFFDLNHLQFADIDEDGRDEVFAVKTVSLDRDSTRYDLAILDFEEQGWITRQTIVGEEGGFTFHVNSENSVLNIAQGESAIATYQLNAQGQYERISVKEIEGFELDPLRNFQTQICQILFGSVDYLTADCQGENAGVIARLDLQSEVLDTKVLIDLNQGYDYYGNLYINPNGGFSVGQTSSVTKVDEDLAVTKLDFNRQDIEYRLLPSFFEHIYENGEYYGSYKVFNTLTSQQLSTGIEYVYETPVSGSNDEAKLFNIDDREHLIVRIGTKLVVVARANLEEVAQFDITGVNNDNSDINAVRAYDNNGNRELVVWIENSLFFLNYSDDKFSLYKRTAIPPSGFPLVIYPKFYLLSIDATKHKNQVELIRASRMPLNASQYFTNFERVGYTIDTDEFEFNQTETQRFDRFSTADANYCLANSLNRKRPVAYVINTNINVASEFLNNDGKRPAKIAALDFASGEMIWSSKGLPLDSFNGAANANIACWNDESSQSQRLIFSTLQTLSLSH